MGLFVIVILRGAEATGDDVDASGWRVDEDEEDCES